MQGFLIHGIEAWVIMFFPTTSLSIWILARTLPAKIEGWIILTLKEVMRLSFFRIWRRQRFLNHTLGIAANEVVIG